MNDNKNSNKSVMRNSVKKAHKMCTGESSFFSSMSFPNRTIRGSLNHEHSSIHVVPFGFIIIILTYQRFNEVSTANILNNIRLTSIITRYGCALTCTGCRVNASYFFKDKYYFVLFYELSDIGYIASILSISED